MTFCGMCGAKNKDESVFCGKCGARLCSSNGPSLDQKEEVEIAKNKMESEQEKIEAQKKELEEEKERLRKEEARRKEKERLALQRIELNRKSVGLAMVGNIFICGVGEMYFGKFARGAIFLIIALVCDYFIFTYPPGPALAWGVGVLVFIVSLCDVYVIGTEYNHYVLHHEGHKPW